MTPVHEHLREATHAQHLAVEENPCFAALVSPQVTQMDVVEALHVFHAHYAKWEPIIHRSVAERMPDGYLAKRRRLPSVHSDLTMLCDTAPLCAPDVGTVAFSRALGWLYVHEGASHGALVIRKSLARHLGRKFAHRLSFFSGYGAQTAAMWSETKALLELHIKTPRDLDAATMGAQEAFTSLSDACNACRLNA